MKDNKIIIRYATADDFPEILHLIRELAKFERAQDKVSNSVDLMNKEKDYFKAIVAENSSGKIVGMAVYFFAYYTWVGKSLYLDDIYVKETYRGNGIGKKLMDKIFEIADKENCKRIRWQVLNWNKNAIEFYKKLGADVDYEWLNCDIDNKK